MNTTELNMKPLFALLFLAFVCFACSKDEDFSTNRDISNELDATIQAEFLPGDTLVIIGDIDSEISDAVNSVISDNTNAELKSLEVVSVTVVSADVSLMSYMDSLAVYLETSNPQDDLQLEIPSSAQLISSAGPDKLNQASFNMNLESPNVAAKLKNSDFYDFYLQPFLNQDINNIEQDRVLEVKITFRAMIST